jgi:hypothetical protein
LVAPGGKLFHRHLQRSGQDQQPLASGQTRLQPVAWRLAFPGHDSGAGAFVLAQDGKGLSARAATSKRWRNEGKERGMSPWRDLIDWVGGLPFEVAKPEAILDFLFAAAASP